MVRHEYHERASCLQELIPDIDLALKSHKDLDCGVEEFFDKKEVIDFPYWINVEDLNFEGKEGICFSGNLSPYRQMKIATNFRNKTVQIEETSFMKIFMKELNIKREDINTKSFSRINLYEGNFISKPRNELIELYIPQSAQWPYMSPMRVYHAMINSRITCIIDKIPDETMDSIVVDISSLSALTVEEQIERIKYFNHKNRVEYKGLAERIRSL